MVVFPCVLAKRDELFSDVTHVIVGAAIHYVFAGAFLARDV